MTYLEFKILQLEKVDSSIEALSGVVDVPDDLVKMKLSLEKEIDFVLKGYEKAKRKVFDCTLIKE